MTFDVKYASHPNDCKLYDTQTLRKTFLIENLFCAGKIQLTYAHQDRMIVGGAMPTENPLDLGAFEELGTEYFLQRREMGVINVGGQGSVTVDGKRIALAYKQAIYIGMGVKKLSFCSQSAQNPAKFYINSVPAHANYPTVKIVQPKDDSKDAKVCIQRQMGDENTLNKRVINQYIVEGVCQSCQLMMGMTELAQGSAWNTMPCHTHERRMEAYFYFEVPQNQAVFHLMGTPDQTRHIVMHNEQAVISPSWSIHSGVGTSNYTFIWGMCGENKTYDDLQVVDTQYLQ